MGFQQAFDVLEANAAEAIKEETGDYTKDGLLHCGKCHTPKQTRVNFLGEIRTPHCLCKCAKEQRDKEEQEEQRAKHRRRIVAERRRLGFPDSELEEMTFAADDNANPRITNAAKKYVEQFSEFRKTGQGLLFYGEVGTGKTFVAASIANALIDGGYYALVTNFGRIANVISEKFEGRQDFYDSINRFDLLVLDDLGTERKTEYMQEIVYNVIDNRYRSGLPMIITTNLTAEELKKPDSITNKRIYDRVLERCLPVEVAGKNRRHSKVSENFAELNKTLGL